MGQYGKWLLLHKKRGDAMNLPGAEELKIIVDAGAFGLCVLLIILLWALVKGHNKSSRLDRHELINVITNNTQVIQKVTDVVQQSANATKELGIIIQNGNGAYKKIRKRKQ